MKEVLINVFREFGDLSEDDVTLITNSFSKAEFKAKQMLLFEGDVCQHIYFIISGLARIGIIDRDGNDITFNFKKEREFITDYESFLRSSPSNFFIEALEDVVCLKMDRLSIKDLYEKSPIGNAIGRQISENLYIETYTRLASFYKFSVEERYVTLLEKNGSLINRVPQNFLASYLGVKPQSLSRIKRRYAQNTQ